MSLQRLPNRRQNGRAITANRRSWQSSGLVAWFPMNGANGPNQPLDVVTRTPVPLTGSASIAARDRFGLGLRGPNSGSFTGALRTAVSAWKINKPATLVWIGELLSNGNIASFPSIFAIKYNAAETSPFNAMTLYRDSSADVLGLAWNDSGTNEGISNNCSLSSKYNQLLIAVGVIDTTSRLYLNGKELTNGSGVAGSINYNSDAPLVFNRSVGTSAGTCDSITYDARIYNRALRPDEIANLYPLGWLDLYYNYARQYAGFSAGGGGVIVIS